MALQKQSIPISFAKGLDLKTDPFQVNASNFLALQNSVFTTTGRLTKRSGFSNITSLPNDLQSTLTTVYGNLVATGSSLYAFSQDTNQWLNKGTIQPIQLSTLPLVRVSTSQTSPDAAVAVNGLVCTAYMDNGEAYYQVFDSKTGQQIVARTLLPGTSSVPRVFVLGNYFIVTYIATVPSSTLQYIAIPLVNPNNPKTSIALAPDISSSTAGYDGYVINNRLYFAYSGSSTSVHIRYMTMALAVSSATVIASTSAALMSVYPDITRSVVFISWYDGTSLYSAAFNYSLVQVMANTTLVTASINEVTSAATNGVQTVFYEIINDYGYDSSIRTDIVASVTCELPASGTGTGTVGTPGNILRSVGLASKAFIGANSVIYMVVAYGDTNQSTPADNSNQPTYFLIDSLGNIYMRLAYSNGGGYARNQVLPSISFQNNQYSFAYLNNDFLASVNYGSTITQGNNSSPTPVSGIYTQTGINLATIGLNTNQQHSSEISSVLALTGGMLWEYDGVKPVENNFQVWPENVEVSTATTGGALAPGTYYYVFCYEWTNNQGNLERSAPSIPVSVVTTGTSTTFTSTFAAGATSIVVSSASGLAVGQIITDTTTPANILPGTYITAIAGTTITLNQGTAEASASGGDTLGTGGTSTNTINVPTLRLTYKVAPNPVRIVGYRWSVAQQVYYQFTSLTSPMINDPTIDYVTFTDTLADSAILGDVILYTTGGVVEDISPPASIDSALFDTRLWLIDAEDPNLLWFSKQCIENVPIEMSDLLTYYVAPTTSAQGSTGPTTAIYPMDDKLIVFKKDAAYYINGTGPDNTGSNSQYSQPIFITAAVGTTNPNSIVLVPNGLMFQSDKGIWLLGRDLSTNYIGAPVEAYNSSTVLSATAVPGTTQVRFILEGGPTLVYDYFFDAWATHTNILAISGTLYNGAHTYLNSIGQVYQETPGTYVDGSEPVLMSLTTAWINLAGVQGFERFYFANLLGTYFSPFKLICNISYNYNPSATQSITVLPDNYTYPWGGEALWGSGGSWGSDQSTMSGSQANVFSARLWPSTQKCQSFQVSLQEVYDPSYGVAAGEGLSLTGLQLTVGMKRGYRTQSAAKSFG